MTTPSDPPPPRRERRPRASVGERKRRRRSLREDALNVPNLLTMGRVVAIPGVLFLLDRGPR